MINFSLKNAPISLKIAFNTPTGLPYGTVNLKYGVPAKETTEVFTKEYDNFYFILCIKLDI